MAELEATVEGASDRLMAEARLGPDRLGGAYAWKSIAEAGAPLAFGSDAPVDENTTLTISGVVSDPGWLDVLTATVDWGDGAGPEALPGVLENGLFVNITDQVLVGEITDGVAGVRDLVKR